MKHDNIRLGVPAEASAADLFSRLQGISVSRRKLLAQSFGAAGALGALQILDRANIAHAESSELNRSKHLPIDPSLFAADPSLVAALDFDREQSEEPGAAFIPDKGLLVGFGDNLFYCNVSTDTCQLFTHGREVFKSSVVEDAPDFIDQLAVGTQGTSTLTTEDNLGRVSTSTLVIKSINDVPDDFLITANTQSTRFTGAFVEITLTISPSGGERTQIKTTYNVLTRSFPLGFNVVEFGSALSDQSDTAHLLAIATQIIETKLGALSAVLLTDLQQDFGFRTFFHIIGFVVSCGLGVYFGVQGNVAAVGIAGAFCGVFACRVEGDFESRFTPKS
jgi:hypothetical protein